MPFLSTSSHCFRNKRRDLSLRQNPIPSLPPGADFNSPERHPAPSFGQFRSPDMAAAPPARGAAGFPAAANAPPKSLRGLNKPKCIQCGNVARSRCPYQSCKSCCSRAQNPCHIHVLKANATFPEKTPSSSSSSQFSTETSSAGSSMRVSSLRQLSNNFSQFNNIHMPVRSKKPLTQKDAAAINEWRFSKLKEFQEREIKVETEAFDRYMQNVGLLKEVLSMESLVELSMDDSPAKNSDPASSDNFERAVLEMKLKLRTNDARKENFRKIIQHIVDRGLKKYKRGELEECLHDLVGETGEVKRSKVETMHAKKAAVIVELNEKLSKARTEEDLKGCLDLKAQLLNPQKDIPEHPSENMAKSLGDDGVSGLTLSYFMTKLVTRVEIDQQTISSIDAQFPSLDWIEKV